MVQLRHKVRKVGDKMKSKEFNKLLKEHKDNLQELIRLHCESKIYLTQQQIQRVINLRGER